MPIFLILLANFAVFRWLPSVPSLQGLTSKLCSIFVPTTIPQSPADKERNPPPTHTGPSKIEQVWIWISTCLRRDKKELIDTDKKTKTKVAENDYQAKPTEGEVHLSLMSLAGLLICLSCLMGLVLLLQKSDFEIERNLQLTYPQLGLSLSSIVLD